MSAKDINKPKNVTDNIGNFKVTFDSENPFNGIFNEWYRRVDGNPYEKNEIYLNIDKSLSKVIESENNDDVVIKDFLLINFLSLLKEYRYIQVDQYVLMFGEGQDDLEWDLEGCTKQYQRINLNNKKKSKEFTTIHHGKLAHNSNSIFISEQLSSQSYYQVLKLRVKGSKKFTLKRIEFFGTIKWDPYLGSFININAPSPEIESFNKYFNEKNVIEKDSFLALLKENFRVDSALGEIIFFVCDVDLNNEIDRNEFPVVFNKLKSSLTKNDQEGIFQLLFYSFDFERNDAINFKSASWFVHILKTMLENSNPSTKNESIDELNSIKQYIGYKHGSSYYFRFNDLYQLYTDLEYQRFLEQFRELDNDKDGYLDYAQVQKLFHYKKMDKIITDLCYYFNSKPPQNDELISFHEYYNFYIKMDSVIDNNDLALRTIFEILFIDKKVSKVSIDQHKLYEFFEYTDLFYSRNWAQSHEIMKDLDEKVQQFEELSFEDIRKIAREEKELYHGK